MAPHFSIQPSILGLIHDPARPRSWQELFDKSDIVSLHVALNVSQRQGQTPNVAIDRAYRAHYFPHNC